MLVSDLQLFLSDSDCDITDFRILLLWVEEVDGIAENLIAASLLVVFGGVGVLRELTGERDLGAFVKDFGTSLSSVAEGFAVKENADVFGEGVGHSEREDGAAGFGLGGGWVGH